MAVSLADHDMGSNDWHATFVASVFTLETVVVAQDAVRIASNGIAHVLPSLPSLSNRIIGLPDPLQCSLSSARLHPLVLLSPLNERTSNCENCGYEAERCGDGHFVTLLGVAATVEAGAFGSSFTDCTSGKAAA